MASEISRKTYTCDKFIELLECYNLADVYKSHSGKKYSKVEIALWDEDGEIAGDIKIM